MSLGPGVEFARGRRQRFDGASSGWHSCTVSGFVVQRYITLAAGGTLFDPDPAATQPGEVALDGAAVAIPLVTAVGGIAWADVIVVDAAGTPQPVGAETFTLAFVKRTSSVFPPASQPAFAWNRGNVSTLQPPAVEQWQPGMEQPAAAVFVVTAGTNVPATGRLAVRIWEGGR